MATVTITLPDGLTIGEQTFTEAEIREYSAGDMLDACDAAERVVPGPAGPVLAASPSRTDAELLCRQVVRIGEHQGPLTIGELRRLSGRDLAALQAAAASLDAGAARAADERGRMAGSQDAD